MQGLTFLRVVNNKELDEQEQKRIEAALSERQSSELILGLTAYIRTCWDAAQIAKKPIRRLCCALYVSAMGIMSLRN